MSTLQVPGAEALKSLAIEQRPLRGLGAVATLLIMDSEAKCEVVDVDFLMSNGERSFDCNDHKYRSSHYSGLCRSHRIVGAACSNTEDVTYRRLSGRGVG